MMRHILRLSPFFTFCKLKILYFCNQNIYYKPHHLSQNLTLILKYIIETPFNAPFFINKQILRQFLWLWDANFYPTFISPIYFYQSMDIC